VPDGDKIEPAHVHRTRRSRRPARVGATVIALLAVLSLVATACGSGRSSSSNTGDSSSATTTAATGNTFGDLASPCGPGEATGATQLGVTDTTITIGFGDDAGYQAAPGLSHEISDAMRGMIKWCNDQGGINGRQIVGRYGDAKIFEVNNVMTDACQSDFMLVGEGWSADSGQEQVRLGCNLAAVPTFSVSAAFANAKLMIQPVPNPIDYTPVEIAAAMQKKYPEQIKKSAVMFANYASTIDTKDKVLASYPTFGFTFLPCPQQYSIAGESDWKPFVQQLKDCGAETVYFTGSPTPNFENVLDAAKQIGYSPIWITDANFYDGALAKWNTNGNADNVYVREAFIPLEEASENPATQQYLDIVKGNGGDVNQLGMQGASAFLLWATGAQACGSTLTSACVMENLAKVTNWTGGGLHAPTNPASNKPPDCGLVLKLSGTSYTRYYPEGAGTYDCDPSYVVNVTGAVVDQAHLDANRVSQPG
jgi:ABC-type branched-subunit amino acid transport system substrate-binding protein